MNSEQRKKLQDALIDAFPDKPLLERMLSFELNKNLAEIAGGIDLQETVFNLIKKADSQQWIEDLVRAAHKSNPNNKKLLTITQELVTITVELTENEKIYRKKLLKQVTNYWIKDVLEEDLLYDKTIINLEIEERPDFINHPWGRSQKTNNQIKQGSFPKGIKGVVKKFNQMDIPRTLLILGEPGGGKTTILLMLTSHLIEHVNKNKDSNLPIPVVFDIFNSNNQTLNFHDWFVDELCTKYKVPKEIANSFINNQQLLLVIDNLDRVHLERQQLYIQALNEFIQNYGRTEIIATFNIKKYEVISDRLNFQSAINILRPTLRHSVKNPQNIFIKKDILLTIFKKVKVFIRRKIYFLLNNFLILILVIFLMVLFIHPPVSEICKAKKEHNLIKETFLKILSIERIFYEKNRTNKGECFTDIKEQIPNGHFYFNGSTTWSPIIHEILSAINDEGFHQFNLNYKGAIGSLAGIKELLKDDSDISFTVSSYDITNSDEKIAQSKGFHLESRKVAQDIIVIVVSRDLFNENQEFFEKGIDKEFIKSIYTSQEKLNWDKKGGPNLLITPYSRQENISGTVEWFKENFLQTQNFSPTVIPRIETTEALTELKNDKGGVFFGSAALLLRQCDFVPLSIINEKNAIAPYKNLADQNACSKNNLNHLNLEAIYSKQYPSELIRYLYVVYKDKGESKKAGSIFANLLLTQEGQEIFEEHNFAKIQN